MSRTQLVEFIAEDAGLTKADAARALDALQKATVKGLKEESNNYWICNFYSKG